MNMENLNSNNIISHLTNVEVGALIQVIKDIKPNMISLYADGTVIGSEGVTYIKVTQVPIFGIEFTYTAAPLRKFLSVCMCGVDYGILYMPTGNIGYFKNIATSEVLMLVENVNDIAYNSKYRYIIMDAYRLVLNDISVSVATETLELNKSKELEVLLALSSKDGVHMFTFFNHTISLFNGLLPLNKSDKVSITLYDNPVNNVHFIAMFDIIKPKTAMKIFLRYLNVN